MKDARSGWNAAQRASERTLPKPRKMHGPMPGGYDGMPQAEAQRLIERIYPLCTVEWRTEPQADKRECMCGAALCPVHETGGIYKNGVGVYESHQLRGDPMVFGPIDHIAKFRAVHLAMTGSLPTP